MGFAGISGIQVGQAGFEWDGRGRRDASHAGCPREGRARPSRPHPKSRGRGGQGHARKSSNPLAPRTAYRDPDAGAAPRAPHHGPGSCAPSEACARGTQARGRRFKRGCAVQAISLCASTMNRMLAAARCRAYAPTKSGVFRGSAPCPCPPCRFLTCGSPDRSVAANWSKELSR